MSYCSAVVLLETVQETIPPVIVHPTGVNSLVVFVLFLMVVWVGI